MVDFERLAVITEEMTVEMITRLSSLVSQVDSHYEEFQSLTTANLKQTKAYLRAMKTHLGKKPVRNQGKPKLRMT
jgi:hypothetical protein